MTHSAPKLHKRRKPSAKLAPAIIACMAASFFAAAPAGAVLPLGSADWPVKDVHNLKLPSNDAVARVLGLPNQPGQGEVCESHFADLRHSGQLSLVVVYDNGGTGDCNLVAVLDKSGEAIDDYDFANQTGFSFDSIEDINGDSRDELIVDGGLAGGEMNHCSVTWPIVYAWTGNGYSDVSVNYPKYYRQQLASLQKQIADAEALKAQAERPPPSYGETATASVGGSTSTQPHLAANPAQTHFGNPLASVHVRIRPRNYERTRAWQRRIQSHYCLSSAAASSASARQPRVGLHHG